MKHMTDNPLVSLIVRTKDRPELLKKALQSIASQTYRPIEVVLVNDGGCDLPEEELKEILGDVSLNYIRLKENRGRAGAGNVGIENAKGEFIGFLDDDDEFYPEHVSTLIDFLRHSEYKIAYTLSEIVKLSFDSETDKDEISKIITVQSQLMLLPDFSKEILLVENYIPFNSLILKRDVLSEVGVIDEELELYEDWDLLIRISEKYPFYFINKLTSKYIQWSSNEQITARAGLAKEPYLKVINKHIHRINPEVLYSAYLMSQEKKELITQLVALKGYKEVYEKQDNFIRDLQDNIKKQDNLIRDLQHNIKKQNNFIRDLQHNIQEERNSLLKERKSLLEIVENLNITLDTIYETLGWKLLGRFRSFRDKILPIGTRRGKIYALCIKSFKVIINEGWKSFFKKAKRRSKKEYFSKELIRDKRHYDITFCKADESYQKRPADIILPVFNGADLLNTCIESVLENTDLTFNNLIIIDDKSIDERVVDVFRGLTQNGKNITIIANDMNIGFVKTVNKGMKMSDKHDVVILNSDTVVTRNWVDKLQRAAYSGTNVATVTPFSNNATICSIPNFLENNQIPSNFDIQSFGEFIENISLRYYPEIPTAVGFCMYIKRTVIQQVGLFDEKNFGMGYGEENDFCMRAMKMGYKNILDDSTFIYHKGGESFSMPEKIKLKQKGVDIVDAIHPEYLPMVYKFINENPLKPIHDYINLRLNHVKTMSYR